MHFLKMNFAYCQSSIDLGGEKEKLTEIKTSLPNYNIKKYLNHAIYGHLNTRLFSLPSSCS